MANRTMLQFDYEDALGQTVTALLGKRDGPAGWMSIAVVIGERALLLQVDPDTDEISVGLEDAPNSKDGWVSVPGLDYAIGSALGWCWIGRNYLGYLDMLTLSFSGLDPQVCFICEAASLNIRRIGPAA